MDQATNFANSKRRVIRMSPKGVPFVKTAEGKKQYKPVAAFKKTNSGGLRALTKANSVPNAIAPAMIKGRKVSAGARKPRSNKGKARGAYGPREATLYRMVFNNKPAVARGPSGRKIRSNKGKPRQLIATAGGTTYKGKTAATRRTRAPKRMQTNPFASLMMM